MPPDPEADLRRCARAILVERAAVGSTITYEELATTLRTRCGVDLSPDDRRLGALLGEISTAEHVAGHGLLSAVVVRKGSGLPGAGFFALAERVGRRVGDRRTFWETELARVFAASR